MATAINNFSKSHFDRLVDLYQRVYQQNFVRKVEGFRWLQFHNPFRDTDANYKLLEMDQKVVAYWGLMPMKFYCYGRPFVCLFSQETLVDPQYRRRGLATKLMKEINKSNFFMLSIWHNDKIFAIQEKSGWKLIGYFTPLKKVYKFEKIIGLRVKSKAIGTSLGYMANSLGFSSHPRKQSEGRYSVKAVDRFGSEVDLLFETAAPKMGILSDRHAVTLNWKYADIPHKKYTILTAKEGNDLCGYLVLRIENQAGDLKKGMIVDLLVDPDKPDVCRSLVGKADRIFRESAVDFGTCLVLPETYRRELKRFGYFSARRKTVDTLLGYNLSLGPDAGVAENMSSWYLTYGESDGDMW